MIIHSDWHIHSEASYDSTLSLEEIAAKSQAFGFRKVGITDHVNYNDRQFLSDLNRSSELVKAFQNNHPNFVLGVELTPVNREQFAYIAKTGTREGYIPSGPSDADYITLACSKEELVALGVRYGIGASHWWTDMTSTREQRHNRDASIRVWYHQQLWLACDARVTVLGHPWYHGQALWYEDFTAIPRTMNMEIAAALKEHGKYVECNSHFFTADAATEKFRNQYAEFLRELHELGIPVTYGSDSHSAYADSHFAVEKYLSGAGFRDGDIVEIDEKDFW